MVENNDIDLILRVIMLETSVKFNAKTQFSAIFRHQNQTKTNQIFNIKIMVPHECLSKNLHPINSALSQAPKVRSCYGRSLQKGEKSKTSIWLKLCGAQRAW